jgi:hypothetical protein
MLVDSAPAMTISQDRLPTKQIDFTMALACDYIQLWRAVLEHCPTAEQIADMWSNQLGPGPYAVFRSRSVGLLLPCFISLMLSAMVSSI